MCGPLGLLHSIALHDVTIPVNADIPGASGLGLAVEHGRVRNIVVLKHALLELTLRSEVFLKESRRKENRVERS